MTASISERAREWRAVALLSAGFGLVGVDRFIILPLFPAMRASLGLTYQDLGTLASAFSLAWGAAALITGFVSDRLGRRRTLIPAVVAFSLLAGCSGLAQGVVSLLLIRVLMGLAEGAYTPVSIAATIESSAVSRRGFNLGVQQDLYAILGLGVAPILATQLLGVLPSWRGVFALVSLPGLLLAWLMHRGLAETRGALQTGQPAPRGGMRMIFAHRNIPLNMIGMCCMLAVLLTVTTMAPPYLTDARHLSQSQMGFVMSGMGWGGFLGQLVLPGISDRVGRKPIVLLCYGATLLALLALLFAGGGPIAQFIFLFAIGGFTNSMICLNVGPLTCEAAPASSTATASGLVVGAGEMIGGLTPGLAGAIAQRHGIEAAFGVAIAGLVVGGLVATQLRETAPSRARRGLATVA
jgi:MFS family permease